MNDLINGYFLLDDAQQKCISAATGCSHEYCMRASQLMKVADDVSTHTAAVTQIDYSDPSQSYVTLEIKFLSLNLDMKHFTIFTTFEFLPIDFCRSLQYFECAFARATLNLTREDFHQFESIIKQIFEPFSRLRGGYLRNGDRQLDTVFTAAKAFLEKREQDV